MGNNTEPEAGTGLYTGPSSDSFKSNEQLGVTDTGSIIDNSGQIHRNVDENPINWSNFNTTEKTIPTLSHVAADEKRYYDKDLHYYPEVNTYEPHQNAQEAPETASYMVATKKEAIASNNKANEDFTGVISPKATEFLSTEDLKAENARLKEQNEELKKRLDSLETKIDLLIAKIQPLNPDIQNALDPNNPNKVDYDKPFKDVYNATVKDANKQLTPAPQPSTEIGTASSQEATEAEKLAQDKAKRDYRKAALIGGVVGATVGILGGATVAVVGGAVCLAVVAGGSKLAGWRYDVLTSKINKAETPEEKAKLEKRRATWEKIGKFITKAKPYLGGAAIGFGAAAIVSNLFLGGQGLLNMPHNAVAGNTIPNGAEKVATNTSTGGVTEMSSEPGGVIVNGRVNLPGSAWDGNLASAPQDILRGGELNPSNYPGGATNMGGWLLEKKLVDAGISWNNIIQQHGTDLAHQLLNVVQNNPNVDVNTAINQLVSAGY